MEMDTSADQEGGRGLEEAAAAQAPAKKKSSKRRGLRNELGQLNKEKQKWNTRAEWRDSKFVLGAGSSKKSAPRTTKEEQDEVNDVEKEEEEKEKEEKEKEEEEEEETSKAKPKKTVSKATKKTTTSSKRQAKEPKKVKEEEDELIDVEDCEEAGAGAKEESGGDEPVLPAVRKRVVARRMNEKMKKSESEDEDQDEDRKTTTTAGDQRGGGGGGGGDEMDVEAAAAPSLTMMEPPETPRRRVARRKGKPVAVSRRDDEKAHDDDVAPRRGPYANEGADDRDSEPQAKKRKREVDDDEEEEEEERRGGREVKMEKEEEPVVHMPTPRPAAKVKRRRMRGEVALLTADALKQNTRYDRRTAPAVKRLAFGSKESESEGEDEVKNEDEDEDDDGEELQKQQKKGSTKMKKPPATKKTSTATKKKQMKVKEEKNDNDESEEANGGDEEEERKKKKKTKKRSSLTRGCEEGLRFVERPIPRSPVLGRRGHDLSPRSRRPPSPFLPSPPASPIDQRSPRAAAKAKAKAAKSRAPARGKKRSRDESESESEDESESDGQEEKDKKKKKKKEKKSKKKPNKRPRTIKKEKEEEEEEEKEEEEEEERPKSRRAPKGRRQRGAKVVVKREKNEDSDEEEEVRVVDDDFDEVRSGDEGGGYELARVLRCHSTNENDRRDDGPSVYSAAFHPQHNHIVATAGGDSVCVYDCCDKKLLKKYKHPPQAGEETFYSLAWTMLPHRSRRGDFSMPVIAAGGKQGDIKLIDVDSAQLFAVLQVPAVPGMPAGPLREVQHIAFSPVHPWLMFTGHASGSILVWSISAPKQGAQSRCVAHLVGHTKHVYDLSVSPNGEQVVSGSGDETIRRWKLPAGFDAKATLAGEQIVLKPQSTWQNLFEVEHEVDTAQFVTDNTVVCKNAGSGSVLLLDIEANPPRVLARLGWTLKDADPEDNLAIFIKGNVTRPAAGEDQLLVLGTGDGRVNVYNLTSALRSQAAAGEVDVMSTGKLHSRELGLYAERSKGVGKAIYCVARSSDGQYLVASGCDNLVYIWQRQP